MTALDTVMDFADAPPPGRKRFTAAEVEHLRQGGYFDDGPRYELLDGELVEMASQGPLHVRLHVDLLNWIIRRLPDAVKAAVANPIRLASDQEPEPDIYLFPASMDPNDVRGPDASLVVEVSDSSLRRDRIRKARIYAAHGVNLYWVVECGAAVTWVHRLDHDTYAPPAAVAFDQPLEVPGIDQPLVIADIVR